MSIQSSLSTHPPLSLHSLNDDLKKRKGDYIILTKKGNGARSNGYPENPTVLVRTLGNSDPPQCHGAHRKNNALLFQFKKAPRRPLVLSLLLVQPKQTITHSRPTRTHNTHHEHSRVHQRSVPRPSVQHLVSIRAPVRFTFLGITTDLGSFFFLLFFFFLASLLPESYHHVLQSLCPNRPCLPHQLRRRRR